jgi:lipoic acid synthetase
MKPQWLDKKIDLATYSKMRRKLRSLGVETVCEQAMCPNAGECFGRGEATFLILGKNCTRSCSFCNVDRAVPLAVDRDEPWRVAEAVAEFALKHVVVTSVTRDDLPDGGAEIFAETVLSIRNLSADTTIEVLIPDFNLSVGSLNMVAAALPDVIAHNVETVPSLYEKVRHGSDYRRSLDVLGALKGISKDIKTKSGIMLGLGESEGELYRVMEDLRSVSCDFLSIGQYLAPSKRHYPVREYVSPDKFDLHKEKAESLGFLHVESGPYVRSSYMAREYLPEGLLHMAR